MLPYTPTLAARTFEIVSHRCTASWSVNPCAMFANITPTASDQKSSRGTSPRGPDGLEPAATRADNGDETAKKKTVTVIFYTSTHRIAFYLVPMLIGC